MGAAAGFVATTPDARYGDANGSFNVNLYLLYFETELSLVEPSVSKTEGLSHFVFAMPFCAVSFSCASDRIDRLIHCRTGEQGRLPRELEQGPPRRVGKRQPLGSLPVLAYKYRQLYAAHFRPANGSCRPACFISTKVDGLADVPKMSQVRHPWRKAAAGWQRLGRQRAAIPHR